MTGYTIDHPPHSAARGNIASFFDNACREKNRDALLKAYDEKLYEA